jgi:microbial collagenase
MSFTALPVRKYLQSALAALCFALAPASHATAPQPPLPGLSMPSASQHLIGAQVRQPARPYADPALRAREDYDAPVPRNLPSRFRTLQAHLAAAAATCDTSAYLNASASTIVGVVDSQDYTCTYPLFSLTGNDAAAAFAQDKLLAVAQALQARAPSYPGNNSTSVRNLILFLRAGYYVANHQNLPVYADPGLRAAVSAALSALFANPHANDIDDDNGYLVSEAFTLTTNASIEGDFIPVYKAWLTRYTSDYNTSAGMTNAVYQVINSIFLGAWVPDFVSKVDADPALVTAMGDFVQHSSFNANSANEWLTADAAAELAHFLAGSDPSVDATYAANVNATAKPLVLQTLQTYTFNGLGSSIYFKAASNASYYDSADCAYYGICHLRDQVMAAVQSMSYQCPDDPIRIVAQKMTQQQFSDTCNSLHGEIGYIHGIFKDNGPVAGDQTAGLEIDAFDSSSDYQTYANYLYGISTDNGGLSVEGDASQPGNIAHFFCYRAEWITGHFEIWNLWHEFTHYMDAKYNQKGNFGDEPTQAPYSEVWWIEGIAEYVSYSYRALVDADAVSDAAKHAYTLPTLLDNDYYANSATDRVYPGGYLSVYFMLNNHRADIDALLGVLRSGAYTTGYHSWQDGVRNAYAPEFESFETCFASNGGNSGCAKAGSPATLSPASFDFGAVAVDGYSSWQAFTLSNAGNDPISISSASVSGPFYVDSSACGSTLAAGAHCTIWVLFAPTSGGTFRGQLTVLDDASNGPQVAQLSGTGDANAATLSPASYNFGRVAKNRYSHWQAFTLNNRGAAPLSLGRASVNGPFYVDSSACGAALAAGAHCTIWALFAPTTHGTASGVLEIKDGLGMRLNVASLHGSGS